MTARLLGIAALLAGCAQSEDCPLDGPPALEIGVGEDAFTSLDDAGHEVTLIHGPQGGYHIELALRAWGLDGSRLVAVEVEGRVDGTLLARTETGSSFGCIPATGASETVGVRLIYNAQPEELDGRTTEIDATAEDVLGTRFSAQASIDIVDPILP